MNAKNPESNIAQAVIAWLESYEWDVYQEVQIYAGYRIADIVAVRELFPSGARISWVIETKTSLSEAVVEQALNWQPFSNYVSVAVPARRRPLGGLPTRYLMMLGIGLLETGKTVIERIDPKLSRKKTHYRQCLLDSLRPEHKTWAPAGNNESKYYSPFKATCKAVKEVVERHPGCTMKDLLAEVQHHHYASDASFKNAIAKWISLGKVEGVVLEYEGRRIKLYPDEAQS